MKLALTVESLFGLFQLVAFTFSEILELPMQFLLSFTPDWYNAF